MDDPPFTMPVIGNTVPPCLEHRKDFLFAMASFCVFYAQTELSLILVLSLSDVSIIMTC